SAATATDAGRASRDGPGCRPDWPARQAVRCPVSRWSCESRPPGTYVQNRRKTFQVRRNSSAPGLAGRHRPSTAGRIIPDFLEPITTRVDGANAYQTSLASADASET